MDYATLQREHREWTERNFGKQPPYQPFLGLVEELGELEEAIAKHDPAEIKDAAADVMIFMAGFCTAFGLELDGIVRSAAACQGDAFAYNPRKALVYLGKAAHGLLKTEQNIRGDADAHRARTSYALTCLVHQMRRLGYEYKFALDLIVAETWAGVKARDWKKDATKGGA